MDYQEILAHSLEIIEKDPERIIALEFIKSHSELIEKLAKDLDRDVLFVIVLAAMKFYKEKLKEANWDSETGTKLRSLLKRELSMRVEAIRKQGGENENGMYG